MSGFAAFSLQRSNEVVSSSSGTYSTTSAVESDVTNLTSGSFTVGGAKKVLIALIPDGTNNGSYIGYDDNDTTAGAVIRFYRGATEIGRFIPVTTQGSASSVAQQLPPGSFWTIDEPAAGTYTYKVTAATNSSDNVYVYYCKLWVKELLL